MVDNALKARWVAALRSGAYQQTGGVLHRREATSSQPPGFCCLGVLCDLVDPRAWTDNHSGEAMWMWGEDEVGPTGYEMLPPEAILAMVGLDNPQASHLTVMNDQGRSFSTIADAIEALDA